MRSDVKLSTRFLTTQNAHQVGLLVTLSGDAPVRRAPINVSLVLDRSGSMTDPAQGALAEATPAEAAPATPDAYKEVILFLATAGVVVASEQPLAVVHEAGCVAARILDAFQQPFVFVLELRGLPEAVDDFGSEAVGAETERGLLPLRCGEDDLRRGAADVVNK